MQWKLSGFNKRNVLFWGNVVSLFKNQSLSEVGRAAPKASS